MKKTFNYYAIVWTICFALFNVIAFIIPETFGNSFWTGYIFIALAFIGQLICSYVAFKTETIKKLFYNVPIISISYTGLVAMIVAGGLTMSISGLLYWVGIIVCLLVLGITSILVISANFTAQTVSDIDAKVIGKTAFINELTIEVQNLVSRVNTPELKNECRKVYDELRYSDPISDVHLYDIEKSIKQEYDKLNEIIKSGNLKEAELSVQKLIILIGERNSKCKLYKQ